MCPFPRHLYGLGRIFYDNIAIVEGCDSHLHWRPCPLALGLRHLWLQLLHRHRGDVQGAFGGCAGLEGARILRGDQSGHLSWPCPAAFACDTFLHPAQAWGQEETLHGEPEPLHKTQQSACHAHLHATSIVLAAAALLS